MRGSFIRIKDALTIAGPVGEISNPSRDEGMGSNPGAVQKKKDNRETPGSHDLGVRGSGPKHLLL